MPQSKKLMNTIWQCVICGDDFTPKTKRQKTCGAELCKWKWQHPRVPPRQCVICGIDFSTYMRSAAKTCSPVCSRELERQAGNRSYARIIANPVRKRKYQLANHLRHLRTYERKPAETRACVICGTEFVVTGRDSARTVCSAVCQNERTNELQRSKNTSKQQWVALGRAALKVIRDRGLLPDDAELDRLLTLKGTNNDDPAH